MAKMQLSREHLGNAQCVLRHEHSHRQGEGSSEDCQVMSMDQRRKIISKMLEKIRENAETMARMGVDEDRHGQCGRQDF